MLRALGTRVCWVRVPLTAAVVTFMDAVVPHLGARLACSSGSEAALEDGEAAAGGVVHDAPPARQRPCP
eukprot:3614016-Rhodomonas_salina.3